MSRTIRSEQAANELQAARVIQCQAHVYAINAEREAFRRILDRRDERRAARRSAARNVRPMRGEAGTVRVILLAVVSTICAAFITWF